MVTLHSLNEVLDHSLANALSLLALHLQCLCLNEVETNHEIVQQVFGVVLKTKKSDVETSYPSEKKLYYSLQ